MSITSRLMLKSVFRNGTIPSEKDFNNMFDSFYHKVDDNTVVNFKGEYNHEVQYYRSDLVVRGGTLYICIAPNKRTDPTDRNFWNKIVSNAVEAQEFLHGERDQQNLVFTTTLPFTVIEIYKNGLKQSEGEEFDFTLNDNQTVTLVEAPYEDDVLTARYIIKDL